MAMVESEKQRSNGIRAHERDDSMRSTASIDQLKSGELLKPGNEVRESAFPATSGGYGEELEPQTIHTDDELLSKPRSYEQSTEAYYDAPVAASESVEAYEDSRERALEGGAMLMKSGNEVQEPSAGGYGGVSEEEPPTHKIHTDDELLPKPRSSPFAGEPSSESYYDIVPEPESIESYQDSREAELESFTETEPAQHGATNEANGALYDRSTFNLGRDQEISGVTEPNTFENGAGEIPNGRDVSEPTKDDTNVDALISRFPDAPTGSKVTQRGYDQEGILEPAIESAPEYDAEHPAKKEGFMAKMMEKLPGHHHKSAEIATQKHDISTPGEHHDTASASPKKGLMEKIKEKLPGHHATAGNGTTE